MLIILGNILGGIAFVLNMVLQIAIILVIVSAVISWVNPDPYNPIVRFLRESTEPMLLPIRRKIPPLQGRFDLSPLILLFALYFLQVALVGSLQDLSVKFRNQGTALPVTVTRPV